jgi:hypothetical protein
MKEILSAIAEYPWSFIGLSFVVIFCLSIIVEIFKKN